MKHLLFAAAIAVALAACSSQSKDVQIPEDADEYLEQVMNEPYTADKE